MSVGSGRNLSINSMVHTTSLLSASANLQSWSQLRSNTTVLNVIFGILVHFTADSEKQAAVEVLGIYFLSPIHGSLIELERFYRV